MREPALKVDEPPGAVVTEIEAKKDIDVMFWSLRLCSTRRYFRQRYWEAESTEALFAERVEPFPRLETVAEHSWHVADCAVLLASHFPELDLCKVLRFAILHDKMEIETGDYSPVGRDGTGAKTHAFDRLRRMYKEGKEREAVGRYLRRLHPAAAAAQGSDFDELLNGHSSEARFVKAVDKLQAMLYVIWKKDGRLQDKHVRFTLQYSAKVVEYFPALKTHYEVLSDRLLCQVAKNRSITKSKLKAQLKSPQLTLELAFVQSLAS